jgi:hypothetical protein
MKIDQQIRQVLNTNFIVQFPTTNDHDTESESERANTNMNMNMNMQLQHIDGHDHIETDITNEPDHSDSHPSASNHIPSCFIISCYNVTFINYFQNMLLDTVDSDEVANNNSFIHLIHLQNRILHFELLNWKIGLIYIDEWKLLNEQQQIIYLYTLIQNTLVQTKI